MLCNVVTCEYGQFHNFKSQNFKSSVSNPKNKYDACVSVLSQISNCQGLGLKNKHEIRKLTVVPLLDSNFPGNPLWAWEFHPWKN